MTSTVKTNDETPSPRLAKTCRTLLGVALLVSLTSAGPVQAADNSTFTSDYFSVLPGYALPSKERGTNGSGSTLSVIYGRMVRHQFALELNIQSSTFETNVPGGTDYYQHGITADAVYFFGDRQTARFVPFLLGGLGAVYDDLHPDSRDGAAFLANAGIGLITRPLLNNRLRLRADARYVYDAKERGYGEGRFLLGVDIPLGRVETRVEHVPGKTEIREVVREVVREVEKPIVVDSNPCPDVPRGFKVNLSDCTIDAQTVELHGLTFEFNKARLTTDARTILDIVAPAFTAQSSLKVEVAGHTDTVGSADRNLVLSQQRAEAVRTYLISKGAAPAQLTARGYGKSQLLISPEQSTDDRERNRRVELRVVSP